jgi:hypothetical protein
MVNITEKIKEYVAVDCAECYLLTMSIIGLRRR